MTPAQSTADTAGLDAMALRRTLGAFLTGVVVVTTLDETAAPRGLTANSFTSVSLDPPLVLVCIAATAGSYHAFETCASFAVNVLAEGQEELSRRFASRRPDKFADVPLRAGVGGAPLLDECLAWLDCTVHDRVVIGDHLVLIGRVQAFDSGSQRPLGYFQGGYVRFGAEVQAISRRDRRVLIGWLIETDEGLLLAGRPSAAGETTWSVPLGPPGVGANGDEAMAQAARTSIGASAEVTFLYSVIDLPDTGSTALIYRGKLTEPLPAPQEAGPAAPLVRAFPADDLPWDAIPDPHIHDMLRRYLKERTTDQFGIYAGTKDDGRVAVIARQQPWAEHARTVIGIEPRSS